MPHPIYGPPNHVLTSVRFTLHLPTSENGSRYRLEAAGESVTSRGSLWSVKEVWERTDVTEGYQPCDSLHHLALVAAQDRPNTQDGLSKSLFGLGWEDVPLPF
jgi:hypothetical protein